MVSWPGLWIQKINPGQPNMLSSQYLKKDVVLIFFYQTMFLPVVQVVFEPVESIRLH
jgi:hypothetical protein